MAWCPYCTDDSSFFKTSYKCSIKGKVEDIPDGFVKEYCEQYNKSGDCPRYKEVLGGSTWCFITTVTCNILNKEDNDPVMEKLRWYRNNILQKDEKYSDILKMYDSIGPIISEKIFKDKDRDEVASKVYLTLDELTDNINNKEYDIAAKRYIMMTLRLIITYGLQDIYRSKRDNNFDYQDGEFDITKAGHGIKLQKILDK